MGVLGPYRRDARNRDFGDERHERLRLGPTFTTNLALEIRKLLHRIIDTRVAVQYVGHLYFEYITQQFPDLVRDIIWVVPTEAEG